MIRVTDETENYVLNEIAIGSFITDGFSKTGIVENIQIEDDGLYKYYEFQLTTGRVITTKR